HRPSTLSERRVCKGQRALWGDEKGGHAARNLQLIPIPRRHPPRANLTRRSTPTECRPRLFLREGAPSRLPEDASRRSRAPIRTFELVATGSPTSAPRAAARLRSRRSPAILCAWVRCRNRG